MAEVIDAIINSAKAGNPQSLTTLAHLQALGVCMPRNLDAALDNLARAASVGWAPALRELQFLARSPASNPKQLRKSIDSKSWRHSPLGRALLEAPRLRVFENFATADECDWLIACGRDRLVQAEVYESTENVAHVHQGRSNSEARFELDNADIVLSFLHDRIARATRVPVEHHEIPKLLHYSPGQAFTAHSDFLKPGMSWEIESRGQRVATFLVYLNDDYEGGETEFVDVGFKFKARRGDALMFLNVDRSGAPDPMSTHAGQPTVRGEKWVLSQWLRAKTVNGYDTPHVAVASLAPEWYRDA